MSTNFGRILSYYWTDDVKSEVKLQIIEPLTKNTWGRGRIVLVVWTKMAAISLFHKVKTTLLGKNRSSLPFVEFPDVFSWVSRFSSIRSFKASRLRQTANVIEFVPRDQVFHLLIVYCSFITTRKSVNSRKFYPEQLF